MKNDSLIPVLCAVLALNVVFNIWQEDETHEQQETVALMEIVEKSKGSDDPVIIKQGEQAKAELDKKNEIYEEEQHFFESLAPFQSYIQGFIFIIGVILMPYIYYSIKFK